MPNREVTFRELWQQLPPVTRSLMLVASIIAIVCTLNPYWSHRFWYSYDFVKRGHYWTILTAPLTFQGVGFSYLMTLVAFYMNLSAVETTKFRRVSDLAFYFLFLTVGFLAIGPYFQLYAYLSGVTAALTYTMAQEDADGITQFLMFQTKRKYSPWFGVIGGFATGGLRGMLDPLLGILFAHAFLFFDEILPLAGGPRLNTPRWLVRTEKRIRDELEAKRRGGHRLGK